MIRNLTIDEVTYSFNIEEEHISIEGNAMASGDEEMDKEVYSWIRNELNAGNYAAWCCAHVRASWHGFHGDAYLGGCSYESEEKLWEDWSNEMKKDALADLNERIKNTFEQISILQQGV